MAEEEKSEVIGVTNGSINAELDATPGNNNNNNSIQNNNGFEPGATSTPMKKDKEDDISFVPTYASTPKKNIRFMDESLSKIHIFPSLSASSEHYGKKPLKNFATSLPLIPDEPQPYNPILYTFRVPDKWPKMMSYLRIRTPPFYLLLDHAIAVTWCMFNTSAKKSLGIAQLQWALFFLNTIYSKNNTDHPKDVQECIEAIEDYLIELYADISHKLSPLKNMEKVQRQEEEAPVEEEFPFSLNYSEILPRAERMIQGMLSGGPLVDIDSIYRKEVEGLKDIAGTESVELMTSKSREAAIDYLNETRNKHLKNLVKEAERVKSLENLLGVITSDFNETHKMTESMLISLLRQDQSSDINDTADLLDTTPIS